MNFYKEQFIKLHSYLFTAFRYGKFSNEIYYFIKIQNSTIENCGTAIKGNILNGVYIDKLTVVNTPKIIDSEIISNSMFNDLNINNKGVYMENDFNYLIKVNKNLKDTKINNLKIETNELVGIITSDEMENSDISNIDYKVTRYEEIDQFKNLLLNEIGENEIDKNLVEDLEKFKNDKSLATKISKKINEIISFCDNSPTIKTLIQLGVKIGLNILKDKQ